MVSVLLYEAIGAVLSILPISFSSIQSWIDVLLAKQNPLSQWATEENFYHMNDQGKSPQISYCYIVELNPFTFLFLMNFSKLSVVGSQTKVNYG